LQNYELKNNNLVWWAWWYTYLSSQLRRKCKQEDCSPGQLDINRDPIGKALSSNPVPEKKCMQKMCLWTKTDYSSPISFVTRALIVLIKIVVHVKRKFKLLTSKYCSRYWNLHWK
jgi:hypothetical protein